MLVLFWDWSLRETGEMGFACCWGGHSLKKLSRSNTGWMESWSEEDVGACLLKSKDP